MRKQFYVFLIRWALNSLGIWVAIRLLGEITYTDENILNGAWAFIFAGLVFSLINSVVRPILIIMSLPVILLTLGLFTIIVNGLMIYLTLLLSPGLDMTFTSSILAGIILSLVNYIVSSALELRYLSQKSKEQS